MELLKKELESEAGEVTGLYEKDGKLHALEAWWGLGKREERFYYSLSEIKLRIRTRRSWPGSQM